MAPTPSSPRWLIEIAIAATSKAGQRTLGAALAELAAQDPSLCVSTDQESGQTILGGVSEAHLDSKIDLLRRTCDVPADIGAPQIAYRETLTRRIEQDYTHRTHTGSVRQFARVRIVFEPNEAGAGNVFESRIACGAVPKDCVAGVEKGIDSVMGAGVLAGFPVVDVKATLIDGACHDVDSSVPAFEIAARAAVRAALQSGGSVLLEPIMTVEVVTPGDYAGSVIGDLGLRRGGIRGQDTHGDATLITAMVPLANMFGYVDQLRSFSQGRATFTMRFDHFAPTPPRSGGWPPPAVAAARA